MLALLPVDFEEPIWIVLLLLLVPVFFTARRSIGGMSRVKATIVFGLRVVVILLLTLALMHPIWEKRGKGITTTILLDRSQSIPALLKSSSLEFFREAVEAKERDEDRAAVITIARDANIAAMPDTYTEVSAGAYEGDLTATNLAAGVRLALVIMPNDTANRIVLASDGNETIDSVLQAAKIAQANKIPIDVFLLKYEHENEVLFDRIVAPARARQGQRANVKMVLRSQREAEGTLFLQLNGVPLDLAPDDESTGLRVELRPGVNVVQVPVGLEEAGPHRFEAVFEPDDRAADRIDRNNSAVAVTFVTGEGRVLVIDDGVTESEHLIRALNESEIAVEVKSAGGITGGLVELAGYDAVVMANIPRHAFDDELDKALHAYVHNLGGGLVMLGGDQSFGAGGWIDSQVAKALPVDMDPPQTRQMPRGALALIMHSCEMPQGNFWGQKVAQSAIKALSRLDYVGIVEYNWNMQGRNIQNCSWAFPMQILGDKKAAMQATKTMVVGDMPAFGPSMKLAINAQDGLKSKRAGQKHAIIISDGDPQGPSPKLIQEYKDAKVTVTTVMVGGHGTLVDQNKMKAVATATGGRFYNVTNPKNLPEIFIKEANLISRSLIQEGDIYQPQVVSRLPGPTEGFTAVPVVEGYVLTAPREGLTQTPIVIGTTEGNDPIYANWNYGLGKSIAYTSDITGRWGSAWLSWADFKAFWEQSIRWVMRPSTPSNMIINTRLDGDRVIVEIEAMEANASFLNFLQMGGVVLSPSNEPEPFSLQQIGPGRYRGEFRTDQPGAYLININYASGTGGTAAQGNLQAAVSVPYSREFRSVKHNEALLRDLAERTGGRMLEGGDPALVDLFDRSGLEVPKSPRRIWDLLAILAAALFIFDVASRRVSIDPARVAALFGHAVGRRKEVTTDTVAAWKRTRAQVAHRRQAVAAAKEKERERAVRFEASEADRETAIDVGAGRPEDRREAPAPERRRTKAKGDEMGEEDYTSRLLRAKRRARGEIEDQDEGAPDA